MNARAWHRLPLQGPSTGMQTYCQRTAQRTAGMHLLWCTILSLFPSHATEFGPDTNTNLITRLSKAWKHQISRRRQPTIRVQAAADPLSEGRLFTTT